MRLSYIAAVLAALATTGAADRMTVFTRCPCPMCGACDSRDGTFYTDYGAYGVNANKGCRSTNVPKMVEFCVDWDHGRAHFRFSGQNKRCLKMTKNVAVGCGERGYKCYNTEWEETKCTW